MGLDAYIYRINNVYLRINLKTRDTEIEKDKEEIAYFRKFVPLHIWFIYKLKIKKENFYSGEQEIPKDVVLTLIKDIKTALSDKKRIKKIFPQVMRKDLLGLSSFYTEYDDHFEKDLKALLEILEEHKDNELMYSWWG